MTLKVNYDCFSTFAGIAGNVLGLGDVAVPKCSIELLNFKIKNEC